MKGFLNTILDNLPEVVFVKDANSGQFLYINDSFEQILGYSRNEVIDKFSSDVFPKEMIEDEREAELKFLSSNEESLFSKEYFPCKSGEYKEFSVKRTLYEEDGKKLIICILEDISQKNLYKKELEKTKMHFEKLFQVSPIGISLVRADNHKIFDVNQAYCEMTGYKKEELLGAKAVDLGLWYNAKQRSQLIELACKYGGIREQEVKIVRKCGQIITLLMSIEYLDADTSEPWFLFMSLDITKRLEAQDEIKYMLQKEQDLNVLKTQFISMISHEFRTPLTAITLSAELLKRYSSKWTEDEKNVHFERIQSTVLGMTRLMENVLTIGRMEAGKFDFHPDNIDVFSYCQSLADVVQFNYGRKNQIQLSTSGDCKNVKLDENLFGLIINNLLSNALKYSKETQIVEFDIKCTHNELIVKIKDYGVGIPEDDLDKLFLTFYRAKNIGTVPGYGLGLAIVKSSIDAHRGRIHVESEVGVGTTFTCYFPILT